ncbi:hypothetical protein L6164_008338 [Bauhinia variegata]|uniref:Uncharacterized protein n=1 Tax=Bauhinia variegata TaxID=167791 RepID=A0ACB9PFJ8_BAUVA|nr:hypothetical protein L6164_008338 [Bauhinia variegata]
MYYYAPLSGLKFNSRTEVSHYLNNVQNKVSIKRISENVVVEKGIAEGLPAGWIKKTRSISKGDTIRKELSATVSRARQEVIMGQSSNLDGIVDDRQIPESACSEQKEGKIGLSKSNSASFSADGTGKAQNRRGKHKNKKEMNLPRRASKRLAGIKADPVPELRLRAPRVATKQSDDRESITNEDKLNGGLPSGAAKQLNSLEDGSETKCNFNNSAKTMESLNTLHECKSDKDRAYFSFPKEQTRDLKKGENFDLKLDDSLELPLGEILTDPCIAFAIQTLTGMTFETSTSSQISTESNNVNAAVEGHLRRMDNEKQGCNLSLTPQIPECAGDAETHRKANEKSGSSDLPLELSWMDPCIEFAVKTLTGNIPLDYNLNMQQDCHQQQFGSSNTEGHCEMALSGVSFNNYGSQYFGMQDKGFKQHAFVDPTLENGRNFGMDNNVGPRLSQRDEDRKNGCQSSKQAL